MLDMDGHENGNETGNELESGNGRQAISRKAWSAMYSYRLSDLVSQSLPKLTFMLPCLVYKPRRLS